MSDSVEVVIENLGRTDLNIIAAALRISGFSRSREGGFHVPSPLTQAQFLIKIGRINKKDDCLLASVNVPACTVGNNVLIQNGVWSACRLVIDMLRYQFGSMNLGASIINKISLDNAKIVQVTLTYLFGFDNHGKALAALNDLYLYGEALKNFQVAPGKKKPVDHYGGSKDFTAYFRDREFEISAYVKSGPTPNGFAMFCNEDIENVIYAEGEKKLRIEIKLFATILKKTNYSLPHAWKKQLGKDNPYRLGMELIRKYFRFDERLRERLPKQKDLANLSSLDQDILEWHFNGSDARHHPDLEGNPKKFSAHKRRILRECRIDLTIPWLKQKIIRGYLSDTLTFNNRFRIPDALRKHSFCQESVRTALGRLKKLTPVQSSNQLLDDDALDIDYKCD